MAKSRIMLLGPPGSGKGTIGELLEKELKISRFSSGDMIRDEIKRATPFGVQAKVLIDQGQLIPDDVIVKKAVECLKSPSFKEGVILDGFPRTRGQAEIMEKRRIAITSVMFLEVPDAVLVRRLSSRWVCPVDHAVFNVLTNPPKKPGSCDNDGEKLIQRDDDKPDVVRKRLDVYRSQTRELVDFYKDRGLLKKVDGDQPPAKVLKDVLRLLPGIGLQKKQSASR